MDYFRLKNSTFSILIVSFIFIQTTSWAASPPNLTTDIPWTDSGGSGDNASYTGVADIEAAFNFARNKERLEFNLAASAIQNLSLPSQAIWDEMTNDAKALYLLNDERTARAGMQAGVIGLPFAGIEANIDTIAENYATLLHDTDAFGHYQPSGDRNIDSPSIRIDQDSEIGTTKNCHEFITRSENLANFAVHTTGTATATLIPLPLERSIYSWIYDDSGSSWGHREAALLQDESLPNPSSDPGFTNTNGSTSHEGFLGFHVMGSTDYEPFTVESGYNNYGVIVVMNIFDPVSNTDAALRDCNYTVTQSTESLPSSSTSNQAPTAVNDTITTTFNTATTTINVLSNDTDPESDTLSVTSNTDPANGVVVETDNTFIYTPANNFSGNDNFSYTISDGNGNTSSALVSITVNPASGNTTNAINIIPIINLLLL